MSDDCAKLPFMRKAHVIPEPPFVFPVVANMPQTFGRQFERLFPGQPCYYCGDVPNSIDHLIPRSKGGSDGVENLVPCCFRCNQMKGDLTIGAFVTKMELILKTLAEKPMVQIGATKQVIQAGKDILQCPLAA